MAKTKPTTKPAEKKTPERKPSVGHEIRRLTLLNPKWDAEQIQAELARIGFKEAKKSTIDTFRYDALAVMAIARHLGMLNEPVV